MADDQPVAGSKEDLRTILRELILLRFNESELKDLYFQLGIDYDLLGGSGKGDKTRELLLYMERRAQFGKIIRVGQELRSDVSWPDISNYILEDNVLSDNHDEQEPLDILPTPLIQIEALAGPLLVILRGQSGKWNLQLENQGSAFLSQATIIFKPPTTIAVAPRIVNKNKLASGERLLIETHITIRPNQRVINTTFQLKFDAVLQMEGQSKHRYKGILDIPIN